MSVSRQILRRIRPTLAAFATCSLIAALPAAPEIQVEFCGRMAQQQMIWLDPGTTTHVNTTLVEGFGVAAGAKAIQDTSAGEALKLIEAGDWIKAIQTIEELGSTDKSMVLDDSGILRPLSSLKTLLIGSMPDEGQRTFRRLNDPAAKTKLAQARAMEQLADRERAYTDVVENYAPCDAAAQAAEELGDIRFEQGRFGQAATMYRFAAEHPGSNADDPKLMARRLVALSRVGLWRSFDELAEYARFRHPDAEIQLGGQAVALPKLITQLAEGRDTLKTTDPAESNTALTLPNMNEPMFTQYLVDDKLQKTMRVLATANAFGQVYDRLTAPVVEADASRLFTLTLGRITRLDPDTGSELWHVGDTNVYSTKLQQNMHYLRRGYNETLTLTDDTLLAVMLNPNDDFQPGLHAFDPVTGEIQWVWRPEDSGKNKREGVVGRPYVVNDKVYFTSQRYGNPQLNLNVVSLDDGKQLASLNLGSVSLDKTDNSSAIELDPRLTLGRDYLHIQTNNGALIAVDLSDMRVAWAFSQQVRTSGFGGHHRHGQAMPSMLAKHTGVAITRDGMVIAKDTRSDKIHAFSEHNGQPIWQAQTDHDATIVHHDQRYIYVLGEELVAYDLLTGERIWWTPYVGKQASKPVFTDDAALFAGDQYMGRIDLSTGELTQVIEDHPGAAPLTRVGDRLITVNSNIILGYRMPIAN